MCSTCSIASPRPRWRDGVLHLATDIAEYASHMERVCAAEPRLFGGVVPRPDWRPVTAYEQKGLDAGRPVADLVYRRT
jgi:tRNA (guanine-N7-)-methyltransferase